MAEKPELELVIETEEKTYKPRQVAPASQNRKIIFASILVLFVVLVVSTEAEESEDNRAYHDNAISGISATLIEKHLR